MKKDPITEGDPVDEYMEGDRAEKNTKNTGMLAITSKCTDSSVYRLYYCE